MNSSTPSSGQRIEQALSAQPSSKAGATPVSSARAKIPPGTIKIVILCCMCAVGLQVMNLRGSFYQSISTTTEGGMSKDCQSFYELLKDAPENHIKGPASQKGDSKESLDKRQAVSNEELQTDNSVEQLQSQPRLQHDTVSLAHKVDLSTKRYDFPLPLKFTQESLVIIVLSRRSSFQVRQSIRDTWGRDHDNIYFVVGQGCEVPPKWRAKDEGGNPICQVASRVLDDRFFNSTIDHIEKEQKINEQLLEEQGRHQDILMMHEVDIYRTLPAKLKFAYTFVDHHLPAAEWVLKVDDDFYVRVDKFSEQLEKIKQEQLIATSNEFSLTSLFRDNDAQALPNMKPTMISGDIRTNHTAHTQGKWKEVPQWSHGAVYPSFPLGSYGHVVNRPIVHYVAEYQRALFDYQGEDVSIGIWLTYPSAPKVDFVETNVMKNHGDCRDTSKYVVGHDVKPQRMRICFKLDRPDLEVGKASEEPKNAEALGKLFRHKLPSKL